MQSYNGWPASKDQAEIGIVSIPIEGTKLKVRCAKAVAPLIAGFCKEFHQLIEPIDEGTLDDWGYAFRDVRNVPGKLSNHASGTAIDLNATQHPLGKIGTFPVEKISMIKALSKKYGLIWGGSESWKRRDEMHWEIGLSEAKVAALIGSLNKGEN